MKQPKNLPTSASTIITCFFAVFLCGCQTQIQATKAKSPGIDVSDDDSIEAFWEANKETSFWKRHFLFLNTLGLTITSPQPLCFEIVSSDFTAEKTAAKYLQCISKEFQELPLLAKPVSDSTLPPNEIKLQRHFEKSQVLSSRIHYEKSDYEIRAWVKDSENGRDNGITNSFDLFLRVRWVVDISFSAESQSFHHPSDAQVKAYQNAIQSSLERAQTNLFLESNGKIKNLLN